MGWFRRSPEAREIRSRKRAGRRRVPAEQAQEKAAQAPPGRDLAHDGLGGMPGLAPLDRWGMLRGPQQTAGDPEAGTEQEQRRPDAEHHRAGALYMQGEDPQDEAGRGWFERFGQESADRDGAERGASDLGERSPWSQSEQAASGLLAEAMAHAQRVWAAHAAAQAAERAAPAGRARADARAVTLAAQEAQSHADLDVIRAQAARREAGSARPGADVRAPDRQGGEPGARLSGIGGLTAEHDQHGYQAEDQPADRNQDSTGTVDLGEHVDEGRAHRSSVEADPAEPDRTEERKRGSI